jgi:hypothetical protein
MFRFVDKNLLLVDPVVLSALPALDLALLEPKSDLLLGILNAVGAVADVTANIDSEIAANSAWQGSQWVGSTKDGC